MNTKNCFSVFLLLALLACSVNSWAESRTATIRVSCTILPALELSTAGSAQGAVLSSDAFQASSPTPRSELAIASLDQQVVVNTNLGDQYRLSEELVKNGNAGIKLYSVTAL